jgi:hypothetical protein
MAPQSTQPHPSNDATRPKNTHGGRRKGAGAPKGNMNAFKHGLCAEKYDQRLMQAARAGDRRALDHMYDLVRAYHSGKISRTRRANLVKQAGIAVLTTWYALRKAIAEEQSRAQIQIRARKW